jgi:hypothetical protein
MMSEYHIDKLPAALRASQIIPKFERPKKFNLSKIAKDLRDFGIHSLKDDKHIEALPLERDGKINPDFHKEIFLGNHELFESDIQHDEQRRNKKLEEIFNEYEKKTNKILFIYLLFIHLEPIIIMINNYQKMNYLIMY